MKMANLTIQSKKSVETFSISESRIIPTYAEMKSRSNKFNFYIRTADFGDVDLQVYGVTGNSGILFRLPGDTEVRFAPISKITTLVAKTK